MLATSTRRRPLGRTIVHVAIVLALAFGVLAGAGGYWAVIRSTELSTFAVRPGRHRRQPDRAARRRSSIARATYLTRNEEDANGELYRRYSGDEISHVVGYASPRYGRVGLELAYDARAVRPGGRPARRCAAQVRHEPVRPEGPPPRDVVGPPARRRPRARQPSRRGRDARSAERRGPRARLDADVRRLGDHQPGDLRRGIRGAARRPRRSRCCPRATLGRYVPGSVFKIVTAIAGLGSGAITPETTYAKQPPAEKNGLLRRGVPDPGRPPPGDR